MSDITQTSVIYKEMQEGWALTDALWSGTDAMRDAGEKYLPAEPLESRDSYEKRLSRTFLKNKFKLAIEALTGQVFSRDIKLIDASSALESIVDDIDKHGNSLNRFAKNVFNNAQRYGLTHILVDVDAGIEFDNLEDRINSGIRPYFVEVTPDQLIGWRYEDNKLTHIRIRERVVVQKDQYTDEYVDQIRVIDKVGQGSYYQIYQKNDKGWQIVEEGPRTLPGVGLATIYIEKTGDMSGRCAHSELAQLNLEHWQSSSDQSHILHVARVPRLFAKGLGDEGRQSIIDHGVSSFIVSDNDAADAKWIEHNGRSIEAGERQLADLEQQMKLAAMDPMTHVPGSETATAKAIDTAKSNSKLKDWALGLKDGLENAMMIAAEWMGNPEPGLSLDVRTEFNLSLTANTDFQHLKELNTLGKISDKTLLLEAQRLGKLNDDLDVDEELEAAREDTSLPDLIGGNVQEAESDE